MAERWPPDLSAGASAGASADDETGGVAARPPSPGGEFPDERYPRVIEILDTLADTDIRVLLVTGPRGVGKSTLCRDVAAALPPDIVTVRVNGALSKSTREIFSAVAQGLGLAPPMSADVRALYDLIVAHAGGAEHPHRLATVFLDDAELVEPDALKQLIGLAADCSLRVVLLGEARLVTEVARVSEAEDVGWRETRLDGLGPSDVRRFLEWRFRQQGHTGPLPFTDRQVRDIARLSNGLPGRIDQIANVLMAKIRAGGQHRSRWHLPVLHRVLLGALVVLVAVVSLLWPTDEEEDLQRVDVEAIPVPPPAPRQEAGGGPVEETASAVERASPAAESARPEEQAASPAPVAAPPQPPAADGVSSGGGQESIAVRDATWVMRQPPSSFTLQLVTFSTAERASAYLDEQASPEDFARFRIQQSGRILHVVTYGSYESRSAAEQAATRLPEGVGNVKPWIRTFAQVQEAVRTALQPQP